MKKRIGIVAIILLLTMSFATAKLEENNEIDIEVDCGWMGGVMCSEKQINKGFKETSNYLNEHKDTIQNNWEYIQSQESKWSTDRSGTSMSSVVKFLNNDFWELLLENFALKKEVAALENRMDFMEARLVLGMDAEQEDVDLYVARLRSLRTGKTQVMHGYSCTGQVCFKINGEEK